MATTKLGSSAALSSSKSKEPEKPKSSKAEPAKRTGTFYEVRACQDKGYRKAGRHWSIETKRVYAEDLTEEQCRQLETANPKVLIVRKVEEG